MRSEAAGWSGSDLVCGGGADDGRAQSRTDCRASSGRHVGRPPREIREGKDNYERSAPVRGSAAELARCMLCFVAECRVVAVDAAADGHGIRCANEGLMGIASGGAGRVADRRRRPGTRPRRTVRKQTRRVLGVMEVQWAFREGVGTTWPGGGR